MAKMEKAERLDKPTTRETRIIFLKAEAVHVYGNGLAGIEIQTTEISEKDRALLRGLFPNTIDQVYALLDKEALLAMMDVGQVDFESKKHRSYATRDWNTPELSDYPC